MPNKPFPMSSSETSIISAEIEEQITSLHNLSETLDSKYTLPYTNKQFGFDVILGLISPLGDGISAILSMYILYQAYQLHIPTPTLVRMLVNITADFLLGSIPVIGTVGDWIWKANERNMKLLETRLHDPNKATADTTYLLRYVIPGAFMCIFIITIVMLVVLLLIWDSASSSTILRDILNT